MKCLHATSRREVTETHALLSSGPGVTRGTDDGHRGDPIKTEGLHGERWSNERWRVVSSKSIDEL